MAESNFRMLYYEQLGLKNVDQRKALESILKDDTLDRENLVKFASRYTLPLMYRSLVWKVLLGILPVFQCSHKFISSQRKDQYNDLQRTHKLIHLVSSDLPLMEEENKIVWMYLLETESAALSTSIPRRLSSTVASMQSISRVCNEIFDDEIDSFWISKYMFRLMKEFTPQLQSLEKFVNFFLQKEDRHFYEEVCEFQLPRHLPYALWLRSGFAEILPDCSLERIWDKLVTGCCNIVVFLSLSMLLVCRIELMKCKSLSCCLDILEALPPRHGPAIVDKTLDLWERHSQLLSMELSHHPTQKDTHTNVMIN